MNFKSIGVFLVILGFIGVGFDFVETIPNSSGWMLEVSIDWAIKLTVIIIGGFLLFEKK